MRSRLSARTSALILLTFLLDCTFSHAQCVAEAGNDTALCASFELDTFYLGGSPTVSGGAPPYTFNWSCTYYFGPLTFTASDFLDDTTLANPQLLQPADSLITFHLVVTDNLGNICQDTVSIRFSFWLWTLDDKIAGIHKGDSIQLYKSIYFGIPPITYLWSPAMGLTDPTNVYTWAKPDTTTFYYLLATDSIGCQGGDIFKVYVYPTGINNLVNNQIKLELYPVPINDRLTINIENHEDFSDLWFEFYNILGHLVNQTNITSKRTELIGIELEKSVYFYRLVQSGKIISQGKLMVD